MFKFFFTKVPIRKTRKIKKKNSKQGGRGVRGPEYFSEYPFVITIKKIVIFFDEYCD